MNVQSVIDGAVITVAALIAVLVFTGWAYEGIVRGSS